MKRSVMAIIVWATACGGGEQAPGGIPPRVATDALHAVLAAERAVYTEQVVNRLKGVLAAGEHFQDERLLPLPAQMFRMGAEKVRSGAHGFTYALISPWPINKQNAPATALEQTSLAEVVRTGAAATGEETLAGKRYFTAVYPDKAVSAACVSCHNDNADSPRSDFKVGDVMGGVVIRIAL